VGVFLFIDDRQVNFDDPTAMVRDEYGRHFARRELAPLILSEICALDMLYAIEDINDGHYRDRLCLKGGLSVRSLVPLMGHRFSFDADFDPNTQKGFTYGDVDSLASDMAGYASRRRCETKVKVTKNDSRLHFIEVGYWDSLRLNGCRIAERPKIEICKTCRVFSEPATGPIETMIDLDILGLKPPHIPHLSLEEQLAAKLFTIGSSGRQRNHFDAYDASMIASGRPDMRSARSIFETLCKRHKSKTSDYAEECRRQLDAMLRNDGKRASLENTVFRTDLFDFDAMVGEVKTLYDF